MKLEKIVVCDLYQVDEGKGYIELDDLFDNDAELAGLHKVGVVLLKKSNFDKYNLKEVITKIPIPTVYETFTEEGCTVKGQSKYYDTFAVVTERSLVTEAKFDQITSYFSIHSNESAYAKELSKLLETGGVRCLSIVSQELDELKFRYKRLKSRYKIVKSLIKSIRKDGKEFRKMYEK